MGGRTLTETAILYNDFWLDSLNSIYKIINLLSFSKTMLRYIQLSWHETGFVLILYVSQTDPHVLLTWIQLRISEEWLPEKCTPAKKQYTTVGDLKATVLSVWQTLSTSACQKVVPYMRERFMTVLQHNRSIETYSLSLHTVSIQYI